MDSFDFEAFFTTLQFNREQAAKLAAFLANCLKVGAIAGVGVGLTMYADAARRGDQRGAAVTGIAGFLVGTGVLYLACRALQSRIFEIVASYPASSAAVVALSLTMAERKEVVDEAYKILRMEPGRASSNPELIA